MSLGISVNMERNRLLLAYIANRIPGIGMGKLHDFVYLLDVHFMKLRGFPMTWFDYYVGPMGPVAPDFFELMLTGDSSKVTDGVYTVINGVDKVTDSVCKVTDNIDADGVSIEKEAKDVFGKRELAEIDKLIEAFGSCSAEELSEVIQREDSLWSKIVVENNLKFPDESNLGFTDKDDLFGHDDAMKLDCKIDLTRLFPENDKRHEIFQRARNVMEFQKYFMENRNPNDPIQLNVVTPSEREKYHRPSYQHVIP